ncbi:uncharacterized protein [Periplaneta americana]|uniref:uncharacterized protein isoform X2 n=1 Tax=Periplaneta americana TaxID=6978 RepID=UPI0037E89323
MLFGIRLNSPWFLMARGNYMRSAPIRRLRHPLEESPLWGVLGSALAGVLALVVGLPVLLVVCILIPFCLLGRWILLFIFWNRQTSTAAQGGGPESVRGNDGRWLGSAWRYSVIHAVLIFEAGAGLDVTQLRHLLLTRVIPLYPRLTRRPVPLPLSAGHCWLPDSQFCIDRHVFAGPPLLTTEKQLQDYVGHLLGEGLPNDKPPWELHVLQSVGRHQDTVAVLRVHQSVADGMALVRVLCHSLADCQVLHVPQRPHFGALAFTLNIFRACLVGPLTLLFWLLLTTEDCNVLTQRKGWTGQVSVTWSAAITLPKVTRIKQVTRSTVNCVLLSALAGAARRLLQGCGVKQPPDMKIVLPVDLRADVTSPRLSSRLGSKMAPVVVGLPVGVEGAVPRLWAMRRNLDSLRTSSDPVVVYVATAALMATVPGKVARKVLSSLTGKATLQFSSLPGPGSTLLVGGHPLKGVYPLLPAQNSLGIAVSVFTYADQAYVAIISDSALGPAASTLLHHLHCQIELLWQLLLHRRVPGESRSHVLLRRTDVTGSPVRELRLRLTCVQEEVQRLATCQNQQQNCQNSESSGSEQQDATRLQNLKTEFSELLSELRRRNSAAVGGNSPLFEDEEVGGELWRPRRRAMSCSSSRRSSRSLVGLLSAARPASFIESYSNTSPTSPASPVVYRPTTGDHVLPSTRPASYIDPRSISNPACQDSPLVCRGAASECILPGAVRPISPEELRAFESPSKHAPALIGHQLQHSSFCSTNITVISEHPSEVKTLDECERDNPFSEHKLDSSSDGSTNSVLENEYQKLETLDNCEAGTIPLHNDTVSVDIAHVLSTSQNSILEDRDSSSLELDNGSQFRAVDDLRNQNESSPNVSSKKQITNPQLSSSILRDTSDLNQTNSSADIKNSNVTHSELSASDGNGAVTVKTKDQIDYSKSVPTELVLSDVAAKHSDTVTQQGPTEDKAEDVIVRNVVHSSNVSSNTNSPNDINAQDTINQRSENKPNEEQNPTATISGEDVTGTNNSTIIDLNIDTNTAGIHCDSIDNQSSNQQVTKPSTLSETTNLDSLSLHLQNTTNYSRNPDVENKQDCVITVTMPPCGESSYNYELPQNSAVTDCGSDSTAVQIDLSSSVAPILTPISGAVHSISVPEQICSPSSSTNTVEHSISYQIMGSPNTSPTVSLLSSKSTDSSSSITSTSSEKTLNSSSTFPPSMTESPD